MLNDEEKAAIEDANFEIYNLITLFLTASEIGVLADLLSLSPPNWDNDADQFEELCKNIDSKFVYYVAGCVASGKTSIISHFRSTYVFDEWLESRIPEIIKPSDELTDAERGRADAWVIKQVSMKNANLIGVKSGIFFMDRAPLDAFAFTPEDAWREKAELVEREVCNTRPRRDIQAGHVVLLTADPEVLETRMRLRGRPGTAAYLRRQQELLQLVYTGAGVTVIETKGLSADAVAKIVARLVFRGSYREFNAGGRLAEIRSGGRPQ